MMEWCGNVGVWGRGRAGKYVTQVFFVSVRDMAIFLLLNVTRAEGKEPWARKWKKGGARIQEKEL